MKKIDVSCKGKAHKQYEFGVKVSVATTNRDNYVVGMFAEHGNLFDGHILARALQQIREIAGKVKKRCYVDRATGAMESRTLRSLFPAGDEA